MKECSPKQKHPHTHTPVNCNGLDPSEPTPPVGGGLGTGSAACEWDGCSCTKPCQLHAARVRRRRS
uniref:Uncharacterized protein n=1 Tax=Anopheles albimanus TaxID=7167 RepID=A0A182FZ09_ANOAL